MHSFQMRRAAGRLATGGLSPMGQFILLFIPAVSPEQVVRCHTKMRTGGPSPISARSLVPALLHFFEPPFTARPGFCRPSRDLELWQQPLGILTPAASVASKAPPQGIVSSPTSHYHLGVFPGDKTSLVDWRGPGI